MVVVGRQPGILSSVLGAYLVPRLPNSKSGAAATREPPRTDRREEGFLPILDVFGRSRYLFVTWDGIIPAPA
jgi:hypothetical protein